MTKTIPPKFNEERVIEVFEYQLYGEYYRCKCGEPLFKCVGNYWGGGEIDANLIRRI